MTTTQGVVQILSVPSALRSHVEWALGGVFATPAELVWSTQPAERGAYRAETAWRGPVGSAARLASAMRRWDKVRFEVTEEGTEVSDGVRYTYTPSLGVFCASMSRSGDVLVHEDALRAAMSLRDPGELREALDRLVGTPWDEELEVFRMAEDADGAEVRWLAHGVG